MMCDTGICVWNIINRSWRRIREVAIKWACRAMIDDELWSHDCFLQVNVRQPVVGPSSGSKTVGTATLATASELDDPYGAQDSIQRQYNTTVIEAGGHES